MTQRKIFIFLLISIFANINAQNCNFDKIPPNEIEAFEQILEEFSSLNNAEAYTHIFSKRILEPILDRPNEFFGTDQRITIIPLLNDLVGKLPPNAQVFDVGAGAGEVVDFALKNAPKGTIVNIEEPNPFLIKLYLERLAKQDHLIPGISYEGYLQDYYRQENKEIFPKDPLDLIIAIHMIYHLTDFTANFIAPEQDILEAFSFLYEHLSPGGSIFIVYADLYPYQTHGAIASLATKYFQFTHDQHYTENLLSIYAARNKLLGPNGTIGEELAKRFPRTKPQVESMYCNTHFFGRSIADLSASALAGELCTANNDPFKTEKLEFCMNHLLQNPDYFGLQKEEENVPQKGFWKASEPQVITIISKES